jgi:hypothetical protein
MPSRALLLLNPRARRGAEAAGNPGRFEVVPRALDVFTPEPASA